MNVCRGVESDKFKNSKTCLKNPKHNFEKSPCVWAKYMSLGIKIDLTTQFYSELIKEI